MRILRLSLSLVLALAVLNVSGPTDVQAQPRLVVGGGVSNPIGDMSDAVESGLHARAGVELGVPVFPVSLRADGAVHRFNSKGTSDGSMTQLNGSLSAVLSLGGIGIGPYLLGGIGKYRQSYSNDFALPDPETRNGIHAGFGVRVGILGFGGFIEGRFVNISVDNGNARYFPVTLGLRF